VAMPHPKDRGGRGQGRRGHHRQCDDERGRRNDEDDDVVGGGATTTPRSPDPHRFYDGASRILLSLESEVNSSRCGMVLTISL